MNNIVNKAIKRVKIQSIWLHIIGWFSAIPNGLMFLLGLIMIFDDFSNIVIAMVFAIPTIGGALLVYLGIRKSMLIKRFYDYSVRLNGVSEISIDTFATTTGQSVDVVTKNLKAMISNRFLPNAYIDIKANRLVITNSEKASTEKGKNCNSPSVNEDNKYVSVRCKGCGATNKIITGTVTECEFCGSQVSE